MQQHLIRQRAHITDCRATIGDHHRQIHRNLSRSVSTTAPTDPGQGHRERVELTGELVAPNSPEGMPRCSAIGYPSRNWVWLYKG